ncbi:MAG TPA: hypothetical protein VFG14_04670, partial [Chthoniobacteraceae bacterium]|nr:hypothetical protein [Chthoniobacteraceae bacterium]
MRLIIFLTAIGLTSCNQTANQTDPNICARPLPLSAAPGRTSFEQQRIVESCIHRWAYRLAKALGPNREIADATLGACRDALSLQISLVRREEREDFDRSE